jgi:hypothetical protein
MTLIELMVSMFLLMLLTAAAYTVHILAWRYMRIAEAEADLQAAQLKAVAELEMDLGDSDPSTIITGQSPPGVVFISPRDENGRITPGPVWQAWVGYYITPDHDLVRKRIALSVATTTLPTNTYTTATFASAAGTTKLVASYDTALTCSGSSPISFSATFTISVLSPGDCQISVQDTIWPRN